MKHLPLTRREFLRLGGLALGAAVLAACGTRPPAISDPPIEPSPTYDPYRPADPANVALAAGRPQLIEFFAFW